jgi:uncharacterized protein (TIGR02118 family)
MVKVVVLLHRLPGTTREAFRAYYEDHHAPLIQRLAPMIADYRRNYVGDVLNKPAGGTEPGFDAVTQLTFATEADHQAFRDRIADPAVIAEIRADEANFLDHTRTWRFVVDEQVSAAGLEGRP